MGRSAQWCVVVVDKPKGLFPAYRCWSPVPEPHSVEVVPFDHYRSVLEMS